MADPFLHTETGLKQIDLDLNARMNSLIAMIGAVATQYTLDFIKQNTTPVVVAAIVTTPATVTDTDAEVLPANADRVYLAIINTGADPVYVTLDGTVATTASFPLPAGASWDTAGVPRFTGAVHAIADTGISVGIHLLEG